MASRTAILVADGVIGMSQIAPYLAALSAQQPLQSMQRIETSSATGKRTVGEVTGSAVASKQDVVELSAAGLARASADANKESSSEEKNAQQSGVTSDAELTEAEREQVSKLASRDREVRAHEQAHKAAGGDLAGAASFEYEQGPDNKRYAVGGEVGISLRGGNTPEESASNARRVQAAALAPANPSGQDLAVAASAAQVEQAARAEAAELKREERTANSEAAELESLAGPQAESALVGETQAEPEPTTAEPAQVAIRAATAYAQANGADDVASSLLDLLA